MKLFLIRHGETVDNVAGLYAGVRDSPLTNFGVDQTRHLGNYLANSDIKITHIFSSPLTRAFKTAEALQNAQKTRVVDVPQLQIVKVQALIEQDFGYYEGRSFYARSKLGKSGKDVHREAHRATDGFVDVESKESLDRRADTFLDEYLVPLLAASDDEHEDAVAIISHGILLAHLWRRLLARLPRRSLQVSAEVTAAKGSSLILEHLGGWSNTGYLELHLTMRDAKAETLASSSQADGFPVADVAQATARTSRPTVSPAETKDNALTSPVSHKMKTGDTRGAFRLDGWSTLIAAVNSHQHLVGLKRQRGGIGSMKHDAGQTKLDSFFVKKKRLSE
ncbi:phosphoglycerate mutase-like protein [Polychaeton citri CBS 116435]|uniref:Phosphoglycerate mutase-like protein n=1 Tax=Polychaeton citri CBS 116435 TaxID=1314669 RepID=A0A9P4QFS2_9PEZI|nr:phosphoglycerate mutase-like protein [Polychaeton citri CBS 116435]